MLRRGEFWVIRADGTSTRYKNPTAAKVHAAIGGCKDPEIVVLDDRNNLVMVVDYAARTGGKPVNSKATVLYISVSGKDCHVPDMLDKIYGDVAIVYFGDIG